MFQAFLLKIWDLIKSLAIAAFIAFFCIRGFIFEPFQIPSGSMMPNLVVGDFLFVSKFAYGNRIPLTDTFLWQQPVARGDVVVFKNENSDLPGSFFGLGVPMFIKRVVAVPGDTIRYQDKTLYINGQAAEYQPMGTFAYASPTGRARDIPMFAETAPNGLKRLVLHDPERPSMDVRTTTVPAGQYVVLGDNRDNSKDSRFWQYPNWGFVPKEDIMGRAEFMLWSLDENWWPRWERFFNNLRAEEVTPRDADR